MAGHDSVRSWCAVALFVTASVGFAAPASAGNCGAVMCPPAVRTPCTTYACVNNDGFRSCVASAAPAGDACDDNNGCTTGTSCNGVGRGTSACKGTRVPCNTPSVPGCQSSLGTCTSTGRSSHTCSYAARNDGATCGNNAYRCDVCSSGACLHSTGKSCDDGSACTYGDACDGLGRCVGAAVSCSSPPNGLGCYASSGTCDPASGACSYALASAGSSCNDGNSCTSGDVCGAGGVCVGAATASCPATPCACASGQVCIGGICTAPQRLQSCNCAGSRVCTANGLCVTPAEEASYRVGACYHDTGVWQPNAGGGYDLESAHVFLTQYHLPGVRDTVRQQLQAMAQSGASVVKTAIWFGDDAANPQHPTSLVAFPPTAQQLRNLHDYVVDVSTTLRPNGKPMELMLANNGLGNADTSVGDVKQNKLGWACLAPSEFLAREIQSYTSEIDAVKDVFRNDGQPAVTLIYFFSEVQVCASDDDSDPFCSFGSPVSDPCQVNARPSMTRHNQQWLLQQAYPGFVAAARAAGIVPSIYFNGGSPEAIVMDNVYTDPYAAQLPVLANLARHRSMSYPFRSAWWMASHGLPLPARFDIDFGSDAPVTTRATLITRFLDDLEAVVPLLYPGRPLRYGIVETPFYLDPTARYALGKGWAAQRLLRGSNPELLTFWSTPGMDLATNAAPQQFDFAAFTTDGIVFPFAGSNGGFETSTNGLLPDHWTTLVAPPGSPNAPSNAFWNASSGGGLFGADLRFDASRCATGCAAVASDFVSALPGQTVVFQLWQENGMPFSYSPLLPSDPGYSGTTFTLVGDNGAALLQFGSIGTGLDYSASPPRGWSHYMGVATVPPNTATVRLQMGTRAASPAVVMDVDEVH